MGLTLPLPQPGLGPGQITGTSPGKPGGASCVFVINAGKRKQVLAAANYHDANDNLVIVPAR